ncbi:hypothetical protein SLA2020_444310 [Shorea laevis]
MDNDNITNSTTTITKKSKQKLEVDSNILVSSKVMNLARPLWEAQIPYKIHIVKDHDIKEILFGGGKARIECRPHWKQGTWCGTPW